ncbi:MAG: hemolysin III family protein [Erysipelothrix sp.]|nr:hemolysin III family protein [Erysipelothrix sp.]
MSKVTQSIKNMRRLTIEEEVANAITHGVMALLTLLILPITAVYTYIVGGWTYAIGVSIFTVCIFMMFLVSTLYHSMQFDSTQKYIFRILDHIFIYFAIAGTYTPIAISLIGGWQGIVILVIQWTCVLFGILYKAVAKREFPKFTLTLYLVMGWVAILFMPTLLKNSSLIFVGLIGLGGVLYSIGAYFYTRKKKYAHMLWHLFINAASIAHFVAIVFYIR